MRKRSLIISLVVAWALLGSGFMIWSPLSACAQGALAPETFADLAQKVSPSVVNISTEKTVKTERGRGKEFFGQPFPGPSPFGPEDPFREFFEKFFGEMPKSFKHPQPRLGLYY